MAVAPSYPGVYIEEVPGGLRTIAGVPTSITAFIGRAISGPTDEPVLITSFPDYERRFGALDLESPMSYAVRDFYLNGGSHALIVRVVHADAQRATVRVSGGDSTPRTLVLEATSAGEWGNRIEASVDSETDKNLSMSSPPATDKTRFNLTLRYRLADGREVANESFPSVSTTSTDIRYLPLVLDHESALVRVKGDMPTERPLAGSTIEAATGSGGSDGTDLQDEDINGDADGKTGLHALTKADLFNILCIPPKNAGGSTSGSVYREALKVCVKRRAMLIVDPDPAWAAASGSAVQNAIDGHSALNMLGPDARNAALYFPCVREIDPLTNGQLQTFPPCGVVAGVMARTDVDRGVWKAPAGLDAVLHGVQALQLNVNDQDNARLNQLGINCLRSFPVNGCVVWGARTLRGADQAADEYKYIPVRRLALFIEESLYRGLQWVLFERNDEPLWAQIRLSISAFMENLFRQGAFQASSARDAYFVKCDAETTTQNDIDLGIVNILVGFAPLKPAEFVVIKLQQVGEQVQT